MKSKNRNSNSEHVWNNRNSNSEHDWWVYRYVVMPWWTASSWYSKGRDWHRSLGKSFWNIVLSSRVKCKPCWRGTKFRSFEHQGGKYCHRYRGSWTVALFWQLSWLKICTFKPFWIAYECRYWGIGVEILGVSETAIEHCMWLGADNWLWDQTAENLGGCNNLTIFSKLGGCIIFTVFWKLGGCNIFTIFSKFCSYNICIIFSRLGGCNIFKLFSKVFKNFHLLHSSLSQKSSSVFPSKDTTWCMWIVNHTCVQIIKSKILNFKHLEIQNRLKFKNIETP